MKILIQNIISDKKSNIKLLEIVSTELLTDETIFYVGEDETPIIKFTDTDELFLIKDITSKYRQAVTDVLIEILEDDLIPLSGGGESDPLKEDTINKQNSMDYDGTGIKFPTVDGVREEFIVNEKESVRRTAIDFTGKTIYFFGDSYTSGTGATNNAYRWTTLVSNALGATEANNGVAGTTLQKRTPINYMASPNMVDNAGNIPTKLSTMAMIVIAFGLNDMGQTATDYNVANYIEDYNTVLAVAYTRGWQPSQILIIAPYYIGSAGYTAYAGITGNAAPTVQRHLDFIEATRQVAEDHSTMFLDIYQDQKNNDITLITGDNIHPNNAGHAYIAKDVLQYLSAEEEQIPQIAFGGTNITILSKSGGLIQNGRNNMISNGASPINITTDINAQANFCATYIKEGSANITFVAGAGTTLTQVDGTAVMNGARGSRACLSRINNDFLLYITNV